MRGEYVKTRKVVTVITDEKIFDSEQLDNERLDSVTGGIAGKVPATQNLPKLENSDKLNSALNGFIRIIPGG